VVSRWVEIPDGKTGPFEIVSGPLPSATHASSVHADQAKGVTVRSMGCPQPPARRGRHAPGPCGRGRGYHPDHLRFPRGRTRWNLTRASLSATSTRSRNSAPSRNAGSRHAPLVSRRWDAAMSSVRFWGQHPIACMLGYQP
jgi:hypothetical protein